MSITELHSPATPSREFDRTPPQDITAEQSVLGGMLLSKDAIADVVETIRGTDFYRPAHELVFEAIIDLYARGEPADAVTVAAELTKRGELARIGGAPYLHTLIASVPTAANAGFYARIVRDRAILRRLVDAGTRIAQLGYATDGGDVEGLVNTAQAEVYAVSERRASEDYLPLRDVINATMDEIDAASNRGDGMIGVPTGFSDLDRLTNGLHPGQMVIVAARPAIGKALSLDTLLPTPSGWTTMGEVEVGDMILAADGTPTVVRAATDVMLGRPCHEVTFDDGTRVVADADHQWLTESWPPPGSLRTGAGEDEPGGGGRPPLGQVRTTAQLAASLGAAAADRGHRVRNTRPLQLPAAELSVEPYALGVRLGRAWGPARSRIAHDPEVAPDPEVARDLEVAPDLEVADDLEITARIEGLGGPGGPGGGARTSGGPEEGGAGFPPPGRGDVADVVGDHIPAAYLRSCEAQRRRLLAGLLDSGGAVSATGAVEVTVRSARLADDVRELVHSLGYATLSPAPGHGTNNGPGVTVTFTTPDDVFALERKKLEHKERATPATSDGGGRFITAVRPVPSVPVRCVEIDHPSHLYLASRAMVPTHNSTLGLDICRAASIRHELASVIFSLEMSRTEITMRLLSAESGVPLQNMRRGTMKDEDWTRLAATMGRVSEAPLYIDDSPNMSLMEIRAKCRRLKQRHGLRLVVVDYLQLMSSGKRVESRQQEVSEFSRALKLLAKELEVPVIAISQLNRGPEQRTDKRPQMSDLRESGSLEQDADVVILLHREDAYEKESPRAGEADLIVAKHRNGPTDTVTVAFQGHRARFVDMAQGI